VAAVTSVIAVLMIVFCARHWMREYAGLGKARSTFLVSLGIVGAFYGILAAWFWHTTSPAVPVAYYADFSRDSGGRMARSLNLRLPSANLRRG
jgi:hypothetical protein